MKSAGWMGVTFGVSQDADPKYEALGPEIERAIGDFFSLCSGPLSSRDKE